MKTYSRLKKPTYLSSEPPAKRRRILADDFHLDTDKALTSDACIAPSTPPRGTSSLALPSSTPPSSPPPPPQTETTTTTTSPLPLPKRRPTFSFFARRPTPAAPKPSSPQPLKQQQPCSANTNGAKTKTVEQTEQRRPPQQQQPPRRLTQLQLDLGSSPVQRTCKTCGMAYVPANAEDAALHKAFHAMNVGGVEVGRGFVKNSSGVVWEKGVDGDVVVAVGKRDGVAARKRVGRVLEVVERELGAVVIPEEELWGQVVVGVGGEEEEEGREKRARGPEERRKQAEEIEPKPQRAAAVAKGKKAQREETVMRADRFKAYLYVRGSKCIGLCLAERITEAYRVVAPSQDTTGSQTPSTTTPAGAKSPSPEDQPTSSTSAEPSLPPSTSSSTTTQNQPQPREPPTLSTTTTPAYSTTLTTSPTPHPATLGISRIWVSSSHRRHGVATALLDAATRDFCRYYYYEDVKRYGEVERDRMRLVQERVAFSQPTDGGARLARRWFGKGGEEGWGVYW